MIRPLLPLRFRSSLHVVLCNENRSSRLQSVDPIERPFFSAGVSPYRKADTLVTFFLSKGNQHETLGFGPPLLHVRLVIVADESVVYFRVSIRLGLEWAT